MDPCQLNVNKHIDIQYAVQKKSENITKNVEHKELSQKMQNISAGLSTPQPDKEKAQLDSHAFSHYQRHVRVDPLQLAEEAANLKEDLIPFFMTVLGNNGKLEKKSLFVGDNINPVVPPQELKKFLAVIGDGQVEGDRRQFIVHKDHIAANQTQIEFEGEEFDVVVRDDVIDRAVEKIEKYQLIKAALLQAKAEKTTESGTKSLKTRLPMQEHSENRFSATANNKKDVGDLGFKMAEAATIEGLRKEKRKAEKREQEKDDQKDMINRQVVREEQKKWDMHKQSL